MPWDQESEAIPFYGTLLSISIDGGSTYKKVAEVRSINGPSAAAESVDVSHSESPSGYREFIGGMKDGGEFSAELNFFPASYADSAYVDLETFLGYLGAKYDYRVTWADSAGTKWEFKGILTAFAPSGEIGGAVTMSVTVKVAGAMDLSAS